MAKEYFPGIGKIKFEGKDSKNPMAFHYYDENKVIMGKTMKKRLKQELMKELMKLPKDLLTYIL